MMDAKMLSQLVCPVTHSPLRQVGDFLVGERGGLKYPIKDGIPVLIPDQAELPTGFGTLDQFRRQFVAPK